MQTIKLKVLLVTINNVHNLAKSEKENNQRGKWKHKIALMDVKEELVVKLSSEKSKTGSCVATLRMATFLVISNTAVRQVFAKMSSILWMQSYW